MTGWAAFLRTRTRQIFAVLRKDFLLEYRTRYGVNAALLFVTVSVALVAFSISAQLLDNELLASLLWNTIFFAAMSSLQRGFVSEAERGTMLFLNLSAPHAAVFLGKLFYNLALSLVMNALVAALYLFTLNLRIENWTIFLLVMLLGSFAISTVLTLISAIVANTSARGSLFGVLSFVPMLVPIFCVVKATRIATMDDAPLFRASTELELLAAYSLVMLVASLLLYDFIFEE
jgi:heme exporter protein B